MNTASPGPQPDGRVHVVAHDRRRRRDHQRGRLRLPESAQPRQGRTSSQRARSAASAGGRVRLGASLRKEFGPARRGSSLGGWSFGGIVTLASGRPFNMLQSGDTWNVDALWPRPNLVGFADYLTRRPTAGSTLTHSLVRRRMAPRREIPSSGPGCTRSTCLSPSRFGCPRRIHAILFRAELFNTLQYAAVEQPRQHARAPAPSAASPARPPITGRSSLRSIFFLSRGRRGRD